MFMFFMLRDFFNDEEFPTITENEYGYVDLGLSVKWALFNVGATKPEDYGGYYAWGETSTKSSYTWENYRFCTCDEYMNIEFSKYNTDSAKGTVDNKVILDLSDDVAHQEWGGSWRIPTDDEITELINNCTWTMTTQNGVNGYKVTSNKSGYTDRSIFLPAAGFRSDTDIEPNVGYLCEYWSSSLATLGPYDAFDICFEERARLLTNRRYCGLPVRPVCQQIFSFSASIKQRNQEILDSKIAK